MERESGLLSVEHHILNSKELLRLHPLEPTQVLTQGMLSVPYLRPKYPIDHGWVCPRWVLLLLDLHYVVKDEVVVAGGRIDPLASWPLELANAALTWNKSAHSLVLGIHLGPISIAQTCSRELLSLHEVSLKN
jgi:hypothetical protein